MTDSNTHANESGLTEKTVSMNKRHSQYSIRSCRQKVDYKEKKLEWESAECSPIESDYIASPMSDYYESFRCNDKTSSTKESSKKRKSNGISSSFMSDINKNIHCNDKTSSTKASSRKGPSIRIPRRFIRPSVTIEDECVDLDGSEFGTRNKQWSIKHYKEGERDDFMVFLNPKANIKGRSIPTKGKYYTYITTNS